MDRVTEPCTARSDERLSAQAVKQRLAARTWWASAVAGARAVSASDAAGNLLRHDRRDPITWRTKRDIWRTASFWGPIGRMKRDLGVIAFV
ncbi:hypothetical protein [Nonomuraea sp. NPDC049758]|uniref:hypothetical protein n=1 Tax=Nonomuraea sp. NPDC049758 TaxID=3154360 RepID=UPI00341DB4AE